MKSKALVTLTMGDFYEKMASITHPLLKAYAEKIDADFIVIDQPVISEKYSVPKKYEKFQIYELLGRYEAILFVDTDIVVTRDAPNVFDLVPANTFCAVSEEGFSGSKLEKMVTQKYLGEVNWQYIYFNSGLMVIPQSHRELFNLDDKQIVYWAVGDFRKNYPTLLNDQPFLNYYLNKLAFPFYELDYRFNHTNVHKCSSKRFSSYFIHYSGASGHRYGERLDQIRMDAEITKSALMSSLSRRFSGLRWLLDRLHFAFIGYLLQEKRKKMFRKKKA